MAMTKRSERDEYLHRKFQELMEGKISEKQFATIINEGWSPVPQKPTILDPAIMKVLRQSIMDDVMKQMASKTATMDQSALFTQASHMHHMFADFTIQVNSAGKTPGRLTGISTNVVPSPDTTPYDLREDIVHIGLSCPHTIVIEEVQERLCWKLTHRDGKEDKVLLLDSAFMTAFNREEIVGFIQNWVDEQHLERPELLDHDYYDNIEPETWGM